MILENFQKKFNSTGLLQWFGEKYQLTEKQKIIGISNFSVDFFNSSTDLAEIFEESLIDLVEN